MPRVRVALLVAIAVIASAGSAAAQKRVRVTMASDGTQTIGVLQSITDTSLVLRSENGLLSFSPRNLARIEQSAGRKPNVTMGVVGLVAGAAVGGVIGCAVNSDSYGVFCGGQDDTKVVVGASLGGIAGGLLGALLFKRERWEPFSR